MLVVVLVVSHIEYAEYEVTTVVVSESVVMTTVVKYGSNLLDNLYRLYRRKNAFRQSKALKSTDAILTNELRSIWSLNHVSPHTILQHHDSQPLAHLYIPGISEADGFDLIPDSNRDPQSVLLPYGSQRPLYRRGS